MKCWHSAGITKSNKWTVLKLSMKKCQCWLINNDRLPNKIQYSNGRTVPCLAWIQQEHKAVCYFVIVTRTDETLNYYKITDDIKHFDSAETVLCDCSDNGDTSKVSAINMAKQFSRNLFRRRTMSNVFLLVIDFKWWRK